MIKSHRQINLQALSHVEIQFPIYLSEVVREEWLCLPPPPKKKREANIAKEIQIEVITKAARQERKENMSGWVDGVIQMFQSTAVSSNVVMHFFMFCTTTLVGVPSNYSHIMVHVRPRSCQIPRQVLRPCCFTKQAPWLSLSFSGRSFIRALEITYTRLTLLYTPHTKFTHTRSRVAMKRGTDPALSRWPLSFVPDTPR